MTRLQQDQAVADQYEAYPYPLRDPAEEATRLLTPPIDMLGRVNHYGFGGQQDFQDGFRALVAGGGTGDAAIYLAVQLASCGGEVVYLDPSAGSRAVAEARARVRGLTNLKFVTGVIEDLPEFDLGLFDYINCTGVLHHLSDPMAGLQALASVLTPTGALGVMVYGAYGRRPTSDLRAAFAPLIADLPLDEAVSVVQKLLAALPESSSFYKMSGGETFLKSLQSNPPEIVDLLLHAREVSFDVGQIYEWVAAAGLHFSSFTGFMLDGSVGKAGYLPDSHIKDQSLLRRISALPRREQEAFCERYSSAMALHSFYVTKAPIAEASVAQETLIPYFFTPFADGVLDQLAEGGVRPIFLKDGSGNRLDLTPGPDLVRLIRMMDGQQNFATLVARLRDEILRPQPIGDMTRVARDSVQAVYDLFHRFDWMLVRGPGGLLGRDPARQIELEEVP